MIADLTRASGSPGFDMSAASQPAALICLAVLAMETGGVGEVVRDGVNGLLVPAGDTRALGDAVRRYFSDPELRERLRAGAAPSVASYTATHVFGELEQKLLEIGR